MKATAQVISTIFAMVTFAGSAHGTTYFNNFESGFTPGDMNGQGGWVCSNPTTVIDDVTINASAIEQVSSTVFGSRAARLGWVGPLQSDNVYLSHSADTPLVGGGVDSSFSTTFMVQNSDSYNDGGARDTFGFRLEGPSQSNLFSFFLTPTTHPADPQLEIPAFYSLSWSTGGGAATVVLPDLKAVAGSNYTLTVSFYDAGGNVVGFHAGIGTYGGTPQVFNGTLGAGTTSGVIKNFGAIWDTYAGGANSGSNLMIFDNVSLVPEPSSALLGLLGVSFAFIRRRRA